MKKINGYQVFTFFNYLFMIFIILITLYPVWHVVMASFSDPTKLYVHSGTLIWPIGEPTLTAYEMVFKHRLILSGFRNTLFVVVVGVIVNLIFTTLGAFFMSIKGPMFSGVFGNMVLIAMYFGGGGLVPAYLNISDLGLLNSLWALIIPVAISTTNMIIMKSAFVAVPNSLVESALLDGANYGQVLVKIMLPLCKATIAVLVLYYGVSHWNSWFSASIYLRDSEKFPVQLVMRDILKALQSGTPGADADESAYIARQMQYALIVVVSMPVMMLYPFIQKYFVKGVMIGAVKG